MQAVLQGRLGDVREVDDIGAGLVLYLLHELHLLAHLRLVRLLLVARMANVASEELLDGGREHALVRLVEHKLRINAERLEQAAERSARELVGLVNLGLEVNAQERLALDLGDGNSTPRDLAGGDVDLLVLLLHHVEGELMALRRSEGVAARLLIKAVCNAH